MIKTLQNFFTDFFFLPDSYVVATPAEHGVSYEDVEFQSKTGQLRHGLFLKPKQKPKGTVVHCHGNAGNVTCHFELILFIVRAGYQVFCFDYGGYGRSEGKPSPNGIVEDAGTALEVVRRRPDVNAERIILFGQSLGGAAAAGAMVRDARVKALIVEATFTTYRSMAFTTALGRALFFLTPFVIPDIGPAIDIPKIAPRPVLIVHGKDDRLIPFRFAEDLYKGAGEKKSLCLIDGLAHLHTETAAQEYEKAIIAFLDSVS